MRLEEIEKLCTAIDNFDAEATAEVCQREQERPSCLKCGGEYRVDNGLIPTALDDDCAHDALTDLARFVIAVLPVVRAVERVEVCRQDTSGSSTAYDAHTDALWNLHKAAVTMRAELERGK